MCLESKDTDKTGPAERTCWCLFRLAVTSQAEDSGGRQVRLPKEGKRGVAGRGSMSSLTRGEEVLREARTRFSVVRPVLLAAACVVGNCVEHCMGC